MQADLESILLKVIHKALGTVGKLQGYCTDELGMGGSSDSEYHPLSCPLSSPHSAMPVLPPFSAQHDRGKLTPPPLAEYLGGYVYELGAGAADKKPLYGLEAELAHELKEVGKIVRSKLNLAFGSSKVYSGYSFSFVEAGEGEEGTLAGSVYEGEGSNGTLGGGGSAYPGKDLGAGSDYKKKYYSSPYGESKYSSYPVFLPKYSDYSSSPLSLDMSYVEDKLSAIKGLLYALKAADYRSLKQIKQLKDVLHGLAKATANCNLGSGSYDDSSSSSSRVGRGADDSSSDSSVLQGGDDSSSGTRVRAAPKLTNSAACVRSRRLAKAAAKLESALAHTLKTEGKCASSSSCYIHATHTPRTRHTHTPFTSTLCPHACRQAEQQADQADLHTEGGRLRLLGTLTVCHPLHASLIYPVSGCAQ